MSDNKIPQNVIKVLASIRATGVCNMLSISTVIYIAKKLDHRAGKWLEANTARYVEALEEMGKQVN